MRRRWPRHSLHNFPPRKTRVAQMHRTIYNLLLRPTGWHLIPFPAPQRVYSKFSKTAQLNSLSLSLPLSLSLSPSLPPPPPLSLSLYMFYTYRKCRFLLNRHSASSINNGDWHHLCITWSSHQGDWHVYKDGVFGGEGTLPINIGDIPGKD